MSTVTPEGTTTPTPEDEKQSFAETAMRMGGKSEDEARRLGAVDMADEQVEALFEDRYRTASSPVHKAVWDKKAPIELFNPPRLPATEACDVAMEKSLEIIRRRRREKSILDENSKVSQETLSELAGAGYWGMLIDPKYGGQGASFARFTRFLTRMATVDPMVAGLASIHGCIGAVDPVRAFGTEEQKQKFLPRLASGEALSGFALTEPGAGSDLTALKTTATLNGDHYEVTGEKLFITNVIPGRTIGLVVKIDNKPAVLIVDLPSEESDEFNIKHYGLYALRHANNKGLLFNKLRVPKENLLTPPIGDGLTIAYHGLNLGRLSLCAGAAGSMRQMLANLLPWARYRKTYGQPIANRELVKNRIAKLSGLIIASDALVGWGSWLIDQKYRGELECIIAKIVGSESMKEAAIELFMKTHGGRSFLHGHPFGDNVYDFLAPCIYEGEGEILGLAFFKSLVKEHGKRYFEPIGKRLQEKKMKTFAPWNPFHLWALRKELWSYSKWSMGQKLQGSDRQRVDGMDSRLQKHVDFALSMFSKFPTEISGAMRKHQLKLPDRQCRMAELSKRVQDAVTILVTALWANQKKNEIATASADVMCRELQRKLTGKRPDDRDFRDASNLADLILDGGFEELSDIPEEEIMMKYDD